MLLFIHCVEFDSVQYNAQSCQEHLARGDKVECRGAVFISLHLSQMELYIFMEYCGGGTLQEIAAQGLREEMVRHYTRDLLKAVQTLHNKEIVHRNIKGIA